MSDDAPKPKKKKGKKRLLILLVGVLVLVGGGVGAGLYASQSGLLGGSEEAAVDADQPQLVRKGSGEDGEAKAGGKGGAQYESRYFQIEKEFTSNLRDSVHFIQVGLAVSTNYDERVIANVERHQLAVRSAVLMALSETDEEQVFTAEGKKALQRRLVVAINEVLKEKEGFGGIGNVYFTNFIVQ